MEHDSIVDANPGELGGQAQTEAESLPSQNSTANNNADGEIGDSDKMAATATATMPKALPAKVAPWATLAPQAVPVDSSDMIIETKKVKKSLVEIMAEEEEAARESRNRQEEQSFLNQALKASLQQSQEDMLLEQAMKLSMKENDDNFEVKSEEVEMLVGMGFTATQATLGLQKGGTIPSAIEWISNNPEASLGEGDTAGTTSAAAIGSKNSDIEDNRKMPPVASMPQQEDTVLSAEELAEIEKAIREADNEAGSDDYRLALEMQSEEDAKKRAANYSANSDQRTQRHQGNVRTVTRAEYLREQEGLKRPALPVHDADDDMFHHQPEAGFRINSTSLSQWTRLDSGTIVGPNNEIRTKHDVELQGLSNAQRLGYDYDEEDDRAHVGNKAYNAFRRDMQQRKVVKGVAAHGTGRAQTDSEKTKQAALDSRVRLQVARAINNGLIEEFNGCVKEGKEALVYHASKGINSDGYDVAVKVFKRISEFRNRGQYIEGDPRYDVRDFSKAGQRKQLEIWAEKDYRNLVRAFRSGVPVPKPLHYCDNMVFMRFLGQDCWPSPQIREINMKHGSRKWKVFYDQVLLALRTLYTESKLVHGDLSEYNVLVVPSNLLQDSSVGETSTIVEGDETEGGDVKSTLTDSKPPDVTELKPAPTSEQSDLTESKPAPVLDTDQVASKPEIFSKEKMAENSSNMDLHIALIDFGQAVDVRHPQADELLRRDLLRIKQFFDRMGISTLSEDEGHDFVTGVSTSL